MPAFRVLCCCLFTFAMGCSREEPPATADAAPPARAAAADLVLAGGYVYTVDAERTVAEAVAIRDGTIMAVGRADELAAHVGPDTEVIDLGGRMVLPGLHDVHIHIFGIVEPDVCSLDSEPLSLERMVPILRQCIDHYELAPGEWLTVEMWNFAEGNQVSPELPNLRAALDAASTEHPIILWGNDGHHGAVNSRALERALSPDGEVVGISRATLATTFADLRDLVGVDAEGEPNGELHEHARGVLGVARRDPARLGSLLPEIGEVLARNGITTVQDAALDPAFLDHLESFESGGRMRFRAHLALRLEPADFLDPLTGEVDVDSMLELLEGDRARFASLRLVRPEAVKIFADGVLEGNPYGTPPTLPNSAVLEAYRQPRFDYDPASQTLAVRGYVDTASALCEETRGRQEEYRQPELARAFLAEHGFHPAQCIVSQGVMADSEAFMADYVSRLDQAGFRIHIHAIGDRAVRAAADALEQVTPPGTGNPLRHGLAHLQLVHPDDQQRIGAMGLYLAWTYAWMVGNRDYDLTVIPFIDDVTGPGGLYEPDSYYFRNVYPVRSMGAAGAVNVAGSDAPVDARSPRPFVNMWAGITRAEGDEAVLNANERIDVHAMIAAYTIDGARAVGHEETVGSIEPGKLADLVVLDRNIVELYEAGRADEIHDTQVAMTLFEGEVIYRRE